MFPAKREFCSQIILGNTDSRDCDSQRAKCKQLFPHDQRPLLPKNIYWSQCSVDPSLITDTEGF